LNSVDQLKTYNIRNSPSFAVFWVFERTVVRTRIKCDYSPHRSPPVNTGPHRTTPGPYRAGNDWLFHFDDELKGVRRANYPQLTKEMNPSRRSWWVGDGRILCFLLIRLKPRHRGFAVMPQFYS